MIYSCRTCAKDTAGGASILSGGGLDDYLQLTNLVSLDEEDHYELTVGNRANEVTFASWFQQSHKLHVGKFKDGRTAADGIPLL